MINIAMVGCGGINSWSAKYLRELMDDFLKKEDVFVKVYDQDEVEEKNVLRNNQNFSIDDIGENKAEALSKKYSFAFENCFITPENVEKLSACDFVILGVDNHRTRRLVYDYCLRKNIDCLDMRAQGTVMGYTIVSSDNEKKNTIEYYDKTIFSNAEVMDRKGSCQLDSDVKKDHIENANKSIACMGILCIFLKMIRKESVSTDEWKFVY